jgi:hypothetical protein
MSKLQFHDQGVVRKKASRTSVRSGSFRLVAFLIKTGIAEDFESAKKMSTLVMLMVVVIAVSLMILINVAGGEPRIDDKYYYDPTDTDLIEMSPTAIE